MKPTKKAIRTAREAVIHNARLLEDSELVNLWNCCCDEYLLDATAIVVETDLVSFLYENTYLETYEPKALLEMFWRSNCDFQNDPYWTTRTDGDGNDYFCTGEAHDLIADTELQTLADWLILIATGEPAPNDWYCTAAVAERLLDDIKRALA